MALPLSPPPPQQLGRGGVRREMDGGHLLAKFSELLGAKYSSPVFSPPHGEQILNLNQLRRDDPCHSDAGLLGVANREISPGVCPLAEPVRAWVRGLGCPKLAAGTLQSAGACSTHREPGRGRCWERPQGRRHWPAPACGRSPGPGGLRGALGKSQLTGGERSLCL